MFSTSRSCGARLRRLPAQARPDLMLDVPRACYVLSSIKVMNRFSHVDLAPPFPPPHAGGKGGDVDARHSRRALRPPLRGGRGGRLHRARVNDRRARRCAEPVEARRRAPPPFPPPCGGAGGRAQIMDERCNDPGLQLALGLLIDGVPRRRSVGHHAPGRSRAMR